METIISGNEDIIKMLYALHGENNLGQEMKPSVFNYIVPVQDGVMVYNTLYNTLLRLTKMEYAKILGEKSVGKALSRKFQKNGIILPVDVNELKLYEAWAKKQRKIKKTYLSINITSTLNCNARCAYCYENGVQKKNFSPLQKEKLIQFIETHLHEGDKLVINWFGGEPLLGQNVIDYVSTELNKRNIFFSSYIITNGSLITKDLVKKKFSKWNVKDVQITLDGLAKTYETRKAYQGQHPGIFGRLIKKIIVLAEADIKVHIRLNIDRENSEEILDLLTMLEDKFNSYDTVTWYPAFLTGIGNDLTEEEKITFIKNMFFRLKNPVKMNAARRLHAVPKQSPCMRNDPRSMSIDVNGNIYTCEHLVGRDAEAIGTLTHWEEATNSKRLNVKLRKECRKCVFLPKCMGGCAANLETGDEPCMIEKYIIQGYLGFMAEKEVH